LHDLEKALVGHVNRRSIAARLAVPTR
jgi:hypothetical protein